MAGGGAYGGAPAPYAPGPPPGYAPPAPGGYAAPPAAAPMGYGSPAGAPTCAVLQGAPGTYTLLNGQELKAGRDPNQCGIVIHEPRISGVHATLKLENGQLLVRDENSNNGTLINNVRLTPAVWSPVPSGSLLRLGPVELSVRLQ